MKSKKKGEVVNLSKFKFNPFTACVTISKVMFDMYVDLWQHQTQPKKIAFIVLADIQLKRQTFNNPFIRLKLKFDTQTK